MLGDIIKKEILDNLLSHKFLFIFILCSVLILFSVYIGAVDYLENKKEYDANVAAVNERMQPPVDYYFFTSREGYRAYRQPQILRTIVAGVEDAAGRATYPGKWYETNLTESRDESNTIFTLFGSLDLMFAVKFVLSLCAIFLAHDVISGEKERNTLKMIFANSVSRSMLISGKIIGNYISMLVLFMTPLLMGLILLSVFPGISLNGGDWQSILSIFVLFLLYISVFFALGIFISTLTARSSTSFLILLFIWVALVIVIPGTSVVAAKYIKPIPSSSLLMAQKGEYYYQAQTELMASPALRQPGANFTQMFYDMIAKNNARMDGDYQLKKDAQSALAKSIARISPASALTFSAMTLARTGTDEYDRFLAASRIYKSTLRNWTYEMSDRAAAEKNQAAMNQADADTLLTMPHLPFAPESAGALLNRTLPDFALMAAMTIIFLTGAFFAIMRYDVR